MYRLFLLVVFVIAVRSELLCQGAVGSLDVTLSVSDPTFCLGPISPGKYNIEYDINASSHIILSLRDRDGYYIYSMIVSVKELHIVETVTLDIVAYFWVSKYDRVDDIRVAGRIDSHPIADDMNGQQSSFKGPSTIVAIITTVIWIVVAVVATLIAYRLGYKRGMRVPILEESVPLEAM